MRLPSGKRKAVPPVLPASAHGFFSVPVISHKIPFVGSLSVRFSSEVSVYLLHVFLIRYPKRTDEILFFLQDLQVQRYDCKQRKDCCQRITVHQQHTDVHKVKAKKCRITAITVNACRDQLCFSLVRNTRPPAILHAQYGEQKDGIAQHSGAKAGKPCVCREIAPT